MTFKQALQEPSMIEPYTVSFNSFETLLTDSRFKKWSAWKDFHRFSWTKNKWKETGSFKAALVAEFKGGEEWWVAGYLNVNPLWLPQWEKEK